MKHWSRRHEKAGSHMFSNQFTTGVSRRGFIRSSAMVVAALTATNKLRSLSAQQRSLVDDPVPINLGLASYTFRNFSRAQLIGFMKQLNVSALNAKDTKDHLPIDPRQEAVALSDYAAAGIKLHAAGAIYFPKNEDEDIRAKFEYCKRAGIGTIVAGDPAVESLPRMEKFVKEYDIRIAIHNHGPEDKLWPSPMDVLKAVKNMDPRMGCCIDVGHTVRAGTDLVQAIREAGPRLFNIHMKDLADFTNNESQVAVGEGLMPVREMFDALIAIQYQGFVDLEYEIHPDDPMLGVISSFSYMRGLLAGMGHARKTAAVS